MKIGDLELSENLFCVDIQGFDRTRCRTHFNYFCELCVNLIQFVRRCWSGKFFCEDGLWDGLPVLIFGRIVRVEYISGYDDIILIL